jgi:hypothetical protein
MFISFFVYFCFIFNKDKIKEYNEANKEKIQEYSKEY